METAHDRTTGETPWKPLPPVVIGEHPECIPEHPLGCKENPYYEGGYSWWVEGDAPNQQVFCNGFETHNSQYPDFIWDLMKTRDPTLQ